MNLCYGIRNNSRIITNKANFTIKKNINHTEKEIGISFDFCSDTSKECIKRNKFYNQVRKDLMRKKYKNYFKDESKK